jgi:TolB protein
VRIGPGDLAGWVAAGPDREWLRAVEDGGIAVDCVECGAPAATVVIDADTAAELARLGEGGPQGPVWSPDGSRIALTRMGTLDPPQIVVMSPDGSGERVLGEGTGPSWSPDGTRLAWSGPDGIVITDETLEPQPLGADVRGGSTVSWSPDGSRLAFTALDCPACPVDEPIVGDPPNAIFTAATDGSDLVQLTSGEIDGSPVWSPDASTIAFLRFDLSGEFPTRAMLIPANGDGDPIPLLGGAGISSGFGVNPRSVWSPDGMRLVLTTGDGLVVLNADGTDVRTVVPASEDVVPAEAQWSPAGDRILYVTTPASLQDPRRMWTISADFVAPAPVPDVTVGGSPPSWQPVLAPLP